MGDLTPEEDIGDLAPAQEEKVKDDQKLGEISASQDHPGLLWDRATNLSQKRSLRCALEIHVSPLQIL